MLWNNGELVRRLGKTALSENGINPQGPWGAGLVGRLPGSVPGEPAFGHGTSG